MKLTRRRLFKALAGAFAAAKVAPLLLVAAPTPMVHVSEVGSWPEHLNCLRSPCEIHMPSDGSLCSWQRTPACILYGDFQQTNVRPFISSMIQPLAYSYGGIGDTREDSNNLENSPPPFRGLIPLLLGFFGGIWGWTMLCDGKRPEISGPVLIISVLLLFYGFLVFLPELSTWHVFSLLDSLNVTTLAELNKGSVPDSFFVSMNMFPSPLTPLIYHLRDNSGTTDLGCSMVAKK